MDLMNMNQVLNPLGRLNSRRLVEGILRAFLIDYIPPRCQVSTNVGTYPLSNPPQP